MNLTARLAPAAAAAPAPSMAAPLVDDLTEAPARVLVVEDDPVAATLTAAILQTIGAQVTTLTSAEHAQVRLESGPLPDVVLSDVYLPGASGLDLCRWVRSDPSRSSLPVVLMTSADAQNLRREALEGGADEVLSKPLDVVELQARVRAQTRLSRARAALAVRSRLDAVVGEVSDGVLVVGHDDGIRDANPAAIRLLGLRDWQGARLTDVVDCGFQVHDGDLSVAMGDEVILHRSRVGAESELWLRLTVRTLSADADAARVVVVRDFTAERLAQDLANTVISSINHKFRTPFTVLHGSLELLAQQMAEGPHASVVAVLERSAAQLEETLARILRHASQMTSWPGDVVVLEPGRGLDDLLGDLVPDLADAVTRSRAELARPVHVDRGAAATAISEFVRNARAAGGSVEVHADQVGAGVRLRVLDDGPGVPPEDLRRVFQPFFQVDRTGQSDGLGLGLALVDHVVTRAGGRVTAARDGEFTVFEAWLPNAAA